MHLVRELYDSSDHPYILGFIFLATLAFCAYIVYQLVNDIVATVLAVLVTMGMFALIIDGAKREQPESLSAVAQWLIQLKRPQIRSLVLVVPVVLLGIIYRFGASYVLTVTQTHSASHSTVSETPPESQLPILTIVLAVVFVMPFIEELVFRGILQRFLTRYLGLVAILVTSLLFAILHVPSYGGFSNLSYRQLTPLTIVFLDSCLYGWLYYKTDNALVSWAAHGALNAIAVYAWLT